MILLLFILLQKISIDKFYITQAYISINFISFNYFRRFIYVETAFFWKWWLRQDAKVRADVRMLINQGRLEIIGGAWSMNDEACTHYHSLVDQFTWGFRYIYII